MKKYIITVEAEAPPAVMLGQKIAGGTVVELKQDTGLATAAQLAAHYGVSTKTIRDKLSTINRGTVGKALYDPQQAADVMRTVHRRGRKRLN